MGTSPYLIPPDGQQPGYKGYPAIPDTGMVEGLFDEAYRKGWPLHVHANGDAAIDQFIASLFPMHTFYWGDWYEQIVGPELAQQISPIRTALDKGLRDNSHTDAPVALPNLLKVMWATVNRTSRRGKVMGADERLSPEEGLKAITSWPAYEIFEETTKGSIEPGKRAAAGRAPVANARSISLIDSALYQSRAPRNLATTRPCASTSTVTGIVEAPSMCSRTQRGPESM